MSSTRYMSWYTPAVYRVVSTVTRYDTDGHQVEMTIMGPYATSGGARVTQQAQARRWEEGSRLAEKRGEKPWSWEVAVETATVEWEPVDP